MEDFCVGQGHNVGDAFDLFERLAILWDVRDQTVHHHLYEGFEFSRKQLAELQACTFKVKFKRLRSNRDENRDDDR